MLQIESDMMLHILVFDALLCNLTGKHKKEQKRQQRKSQL